MKPTYYASYKTIDGKRSAIFVDELGEEVIVADATYEDWLATEPFTNKSLIQAKTIILGIIYVVFAVTLVMNGITIATWSFWSIIIPFTISSTFMHRYWGLTRKHNEYVL